MFHNVSFFMNDIFYSKYLEDASLKVDARTRYTKKVIQDCFFELLKEKPLNKITVKSICDKSEINRSTFYRYYTDSFDLMEQIELELIDAFQLYIKETEFSNITQAIEVVLNAIKLNKELYTILVSDNGDRSFISRILSSSYELLKSNLKKQLPRLTPRQHEWLYYFISQGCISIIIDWIQNGMVEDSSEVSIFIAKLDTILLESLQ